MATKKDRYFAYVEAVFASELSAHSKIILLAIADHYNWTTNSPAYPSFPTLAQKTSLHLNTVRNHVKALHEKGWLEFQGLKKLENITVNMWKPTVPPLQIVDSPLQNFDLTPTNWEPDFGGKQIHITNIYKQRNTNKVKETKGLARLYSLVQKGNSSGRKSS